MRFQPPFALKDQAAAQAFSHVSRSIDSVLRVPTFAEAIDATVNVRAGEFRRLAPRSGGMTVVLPEAVAGNAGQSVFLTVNGLGTLTVLPVVGTINGASSIAFAAGSYSIEITSDGSGRWLTPGLVDGAVTAVKLADGAVTNAKAADMAAATLKGRALGAGTGDPTDLTGAQVADIIETEAFTWTGAWNCNNRVRWSSIFTQTLTGNTDNLAIGAVNVVRLVGNTFNLTGMVPNADDQIVWLQNADAADTMVLVHDATSTAANRFYCPNNANYTMQPRSAVWARYDAASTRWYIGVGA